MKVGLKRCKKNCFNSSYKMYGSYVDYKMGKRVIGTNGFLEQEGRTGFTISMNKARLVAQGYRKREGLINDEVFAQLQNRSNQNSFWHLASFMGFMSIRWRVKSAFYMATSQKRCMSNSLQIKNIYVKDILNKFDFRTIKPASTPIEAHKSLGKDEEGEEVDVHLYRSMIGYLMYLTASRPDIICCLLCVQGFQVTPKVSSHTSSKRILRYLKHQPKLGLWYPKDSPFHLEAFLDSDYAGDNHDRRSTSGVYCIQDTAQKMKLKRLKASIATMTRQTDAEQGRPTIKKLEVKQVEFKLGEDCWEIQVKRSKYC
ncbi:hypothetical protein Tco_1335294 [Tanacetum coccineum]